MILQLDQGRLAYTEGSLRTTGRSGTFRKHAACPAPCQVRCDAKFASDAGNLVRSLVPAPLTQWSHARPGLRSSLGALGALRPALRRAY